MIMVLWLTIKKAQVVLGFLEKSLKNILAFCYIFRNFEILPNTKIASSSCSLKITKTDVCLIFFHGLFGPKPFGSGGGAGIPFPPTPFPSRAAGAAGIFCETPSGVSLKESSNLVVNILHNQTFCKFAVHFGGGAKRRPSILPRQILSARRAQARLAVGQDEVRLPCDLILSRYALPKIIN